MAREELEESETRRKEPTAESGERSADADNQSTTGKRKAEGPEDEGRAPDQLGGGSSSGGAPEAAASSSGPKGPKV